MKLLACDIGSTNLKLQVFTISCDAPLPRPVGKACIVNHGQDWLKADQPLDALSKWLSEMVELIIQNYAGKVDAVGFSTFREALVGLSPTGQIVFAGTNLQKKPIGILEEASKVTTFAGWMCWKLTGQCRITDGQRAAGDAYIARISQSTPRWASLIVAGKSMQTEHASPFDVYLGGTDEQLGYVGAGLFDSDGPQLVIATGTFWSVSSIAVGPSQSGIRRTEGVSPFLSVDSCVFYKWGPMMHALAEGSIAGTGNESVPERFFGHAASLWFSDGASLAVTRRAVADDLKAACAMLAPNGDAHVVVHGGGARMGYAQNLIRKACRKAELTFMDDDTTLLGCAIIGRGIHDAN